MATSDGNEEKHHPAFIDDAAKELLLQRYSDLKFVDDDTELSCKRCDRVVIHHYVANCGHLFCKNCKRMLSYSERWKSRCPKCNQPITHIERQEVEVERRVNELMLHCPNHKYGCKIITKLQHMPEHIKKCGETRNANLPALLDETSPNANILIRMSQMSKSLNELNERCDLLKSRVGDESRQQQIDSKLEEMENIVKGSALMMAKLQAQLAKNSSRLTELDREINGRSQEVSIRLSDLEMQQSQINDSFKQRSEAFENNPSNYSQIKMDAMEQNIKTNLAKDFSRQMNAMGKNINRLSKELEKRSAETASQLSAIKNRVEELDDNRRKDFQMKLDQLSVEIKNELRRFMDEMRRTNANDTSRDNVRDDQGLTMTRIPQSTRKPILTNGHGISEFNILLLGPIGSGKSTFVNSLVNYLKYRTFDEAEAGGTQCLIPGNFTFRKSNRDGKTVAFGEPSDNEDTGLVGRHSQLLRSKTKACKSYDFNYNQYVIRVIDSPGIYSFQPGETPMNLTNILESLKKYRQLHAIAIVINNSDSLLFSRWSVEDMMSRLGESATANVTWLFTCSSNKATEDHTNSTIRKMLSDIERKRMSEPRIPLNYNNSFHLDNRAFRHLILKSKGLSEDAKGMRTTWSYSVNECKRMLHYVINGPDGKGLQPLPINNTFRL